MQLRHFRTASHQKTLPCTFGMEVQQEMEMLWWHLINIWSSPMAWYPPCQTSQLQIWVGSGLLGQMSLKVKALAGTRRLKL
jgi:hypothetical protein